jgi:hypothetical protein
VSAELFWQVVFWGSFASFTAVSLLVAVRGVGELRALFRSLRSRDGG